MRLEWNIKISICNFCDVQALHNQQQFINHGGTVTDLHITACDRCQEPNSKLMLHIQIPLNL